MPTTRQSSRLLAALLLLFVSLSASPAFAQRDVLLPVQGLLTDDSGVPLDATVSIRFSLYSDATQATPLWSELQTVIVEDGLFTAYLGGVTGMNSDLFAQNAGVYFAMRVADDAESDRLPLAFAPYAAYAEHANDAQTLQGKQPSELVTALPAASVTFDDSQANLQANNAQLALVRLAARLDALEADNTALRARLQTVETEQQGLSGLTTSVAQLQTQVMTTSQTVNTFNNRINTLEGTATTLNNRVGATESGLSSLTMRVATNEGAITTLGNTTTALNTRVSAAETLNTTQTTRLNTLDGQVGGLTTRVSALETKTQSMSATSDQVTFSNVNVRIVSGSGATEGASNGRGNLIIGYNEARASGSLKTGSHNLVLGRLNNYTSHGSIIGGVSNDVTAPFASVLSGDSNKATGTGAVIVSGLSNTASSARAVVVGGWRNTASGLDSAVLGGDSNTAQVSDATVGGGQNQTNSTSARFRAQGTLVP